MIAPPSRSNYPSHQEIAPPHSPFVARRLLLAPRDHATRDLECPGVGCRRGRVLRRSIIPPGIRPTSSGVFSGHYAQSLAALIYG